MECDLAYGDLLSNLEVTRATIVLSSARNLQYSEMMSCMLDQWTVSGRRIASGGEKFHELARTPNLRHKWVGIGQLHDRVLFARAFYAIMNSVLYYCPMLTVD